ncbi:MAG: UPF0280 family protein [Bacillota bacterium]|jgi:ApbE superfamily uncharacterized protein (UPF0280 family)
MTDDQPIYPNSQYVARSYRAWAAPDLLEYRICIGESDLMILASRDWRTEASRLLKTYRRELKQYLTYHPAFAHTLTPWPVDPAAPPIVQWMIEASHGAGVGPMAAVAGALAGMLGKTLAANDAELIIENGGDIYLRSALQRVVAVYAGESPFSQKLGLLIPAAPEGIGVCTSAGTVGPSLSFGAADAAVIIAPDVALADAVATATANLVKSAADFPAALAFVRSIAGVRGALIIKGDQLTAWGQIELAPLG